MPSRTKKAISFETKDIKDEEMDCATGWQIAV